MILATKENKFIPLILFLLILPSATYCCTFTSSFSDVLQESTFHPEASTHFVLSFSKEKRNSLGMWKIPELGNEVEKKIEIKN